VSTEAGRATVSAGQGTYRETDAFRELVSSTATVGGADWCRTLLMCATDLATVPDGAVLLRNGAGGLSAAHASDPGLLGHSAAMAAAGWGPLLECLDTGRPLSVATRRADGAGVPDGIAGVFAGLHLFPVSHRGDGHGVVMVCDRVPDRLGARQADAVSFIAAAAGLLVSHAQEVAEARRLAAQLQHALDSRVLVEQAKGYVAGRDGHDIGTAFRVLREKARSERRPLADVAKETLPGV